MINVARNLSLTSLTSSAYEVKNNCCLFERLFKVKKSGVSLLGISFFVLEKFTFLYCANDESDDVIGGSIWTVKHRIKNISRNIEAVFFKLGIKNVHHKRNRKTPAVLLPWQHFCLQSLSEIGRTQYVLGKPCPEQQRTCKKLVKNL